MSTGLETEDNWIHGWRGLSAMRRSEDWPDYVLSRPLIAQPGERFEYSNGVSHLLGVVLQEAVGETAHDYARERLFDPLGIGETDWEVDNEGRNLGYAGLRIHPLDLARIGYLYLRGGEWDGERVLSADWVEASLSARIEAGTLAEGYGYQWWIHEDGVKAMYGHAGQCVFLVPEHDLVVVFVSAMPSRYFFTPLRLLHEYVIPAVRSRDVLGERPSNLARLEAAKAVLGTQERERAQPAARGGPGRVRPKVRVRTQRERAACPHTALRSRRRGGDLGAGLRRRRDGDPRRPGRYFPVQQATRRALGLPRALGGRRDAAHRAGTPEPRQPPPHNAPLARGRPRLRVHRTRRRP